jgi:hypothetical protein
MEIYINQKSLQSGNEKNSNTTSTGRKMQNEYGMRTD